LTRARLTRRARVAYALAFVLPLLTAVFVACSVSNVPIYDEWLWAPLVVAAHTGHLQPSALWIQQNSHRSVVPTALALGLAALTGWDTRAEALISVLLIATSQACVLCLFVRERGAERAAVPFLAASLLLYSLAQVENLLWGFQLSWFLVNALVFAMLVALGWQAPRPADAVRFAAALCCAVAATFSMLFGFAAWPAGFVLLGRGAGMRRSLPLVLWVLAAVACAVAYTHGYQRPPDEHGWFAEAASPWLDLPQFALAVLGAPLGLAGGRWLCELLGLGLCAAFAVLTARAARHARAGDAWSGLFVFAVVVAVLTAAGRTAYGVDAAVISRYTTPATLGWIALAGRASALGRIPRPVVVAAAALFAVTNLAGVFVSWQIAGEQRDLAARIRHVDAASDAELRRAFTNNYRLDQPGFIRAQTRELEALRLGPFRSPAVDAGPLAPAALGSTLPRAVVVATAQPQILAVAIEEPPYRWGELLHVRVVTTTNTGAVEVTPFANLPVRLPFRLHQTSLGEFSGLLRIPFGPPGWRSPRLPFVVTVTAIGAEGRTATRRLTFELAS
jgi:hypothetical protein